MTTLIMNNSGTTAFDRVIDRSLNEVGNFLDKHKQVYKVVIVANHFFRAAMMWTLRAMMPFTPAVSFLVSFAASVSYRATIERFCQFRFAVLSCLGAFAFQISAPSIALIVNGLALASIKAFASAMLGIIPAILYLVTVVWVSNSSVEDHAKKNLKTSCCASTGVGHHSLSVSSPLYSTDALEDETSHTPSAVTDDSYYGSGSSTGSLRLSSAARAATVSTSASAYSSRTGE